MAKKIALTVLCALLLFPACRTGAAITSTVKCYSGGVLIHETDHANVDWQHEYFRWSVGNTDYYSNADCISSKRR